FHSFSLSHSPTLSLPLSLSLSLMLCVHSVCSTSFFPSLECYSNPTSWVPGSELTGSPAESEVVCVRVCGCVCVCVCLWHTCVHRMWLCFCVHENICKLAFVCVRVRARTCLCVLA